ncbi:MAG: hypothetical protein RBQ88_07930 [Desulfobulbus oligotrophicus]|nr:hypothetical protein [Desulfobulbus oligotrophicus]
MSRKWRAMIIAAGLTVAVLVFLPVLLTSAPVFALLQHYLTQHIPGKLEIATCAAGWLEGLRCEQVRYVDPVQKVEVTVPHLTVDKGLLALLVAPTYLGEVTVDQPVCTFYPPPAEHPQDVPAAGIAAEDPPPSEAIAADSPRWQQFGLRLRVRNGQAFLQHGDKPPQLLARQIDCTGSLVQGSVSYELAFTSPHADGHLTGSGTFHLPRSADESWDALISNTELRIRNLVIDDFLTLAAASWSTVPQGSGRLDASFRINAIGLTEAEVRGEATLHDLHLTGGVLSKDQPRLNELSLDFKGSRRPADGWRLAELTLHSDPVNLHVTGTYDDDIVSFQSRGQVKIPALATELPHLLRIHERTVIDEGVTDFSLTIKGRSTALVIQADCRTDHLRFVHDQQAYSWTMPLHFELEAVHGEQSGVRNLRLRMPFFELHGDSSDKGFVLSGEGDLERMSRELSRLFLMDFQARGQIKIAATSRDDGSDKRHVDSKLTINNFSLLKDNQVLIPAHPLVITAAVTTERSRLDLHTVHGLSLEATAWPGTLSFHARDVQQCAGHSDDNFSMQGRLDMGRLHGLAQGSVWGNHVSALQGAIRFEAAGTWCGDVVAVQNLQGEIADLTVSGEEFIIREPRVTFGLGGRTTKEVAQQVSLQRLLVVEDWPDFADKAGPLLQFNIDQHSVDIRRLIWSSERAAIELSGAVNDRQQMNVGYWLMAQGEGEGSFAGDVLKAAKILPADFNLKGKLRGNWSLQGGYGQKREQTIFFEVASLAVTRGKRVMVSDPLVTCGFRLQETADQPSELRMTDFNLRSKLVHLAGVGRIMRKEQPNLSMQGQFAPQYVQLQPLLQPYIGRGIAWSGNRPGTFQLSMPLTTPVQQGDITVTAELPMDSLRFRDMDLGAVHLPLDFHRNQLRLRIDGELDGGKVSLAPLWDVTAAKPVLSLPAKAPCLAGVSPQPPLLDGVLGRLHPLFGVFAQVRGTMDLSINHFSVPISARGWQSPVFSISLVVDRLQFTPMGPLQEVLSLNGYVQEWFSCVEKEIRCEGKNGRVQCDPVHLLVDDEQIALQGELSSDQQLQYTVQFPLGQALAQLIGLDTDSDSDDRRLVTAVINGARQNPEFDAHALVTGLAHQLIKSRRSDRYKKLPQTDEPVEP